MAQSAILMVILQLNVSADKKIVVSYIGYESQVLDVLDKSFLEIYLSEDIKLIDEVVVVG